jgi:hypothetical protein
MSTVSIFFYIELLSDLVGYVAGRGGSSEVSSHSCWLTEAPVELASLFG